MKDKPTNYAKVPVPAAFLPRFRASYNEDNALRFKGIFDKCIDNEYINGKKLNLWLDPMTLNLSLVTYHHRISEALKYLVENPIRGSKYTQDDYAKLRGKIHFKKQLGINNSWGIAIIYRRSHLLKVNPDKDVVVIGNADDIEDATEVKSEKWKLEIHDYLENENRQILEIIGVENLGKLLNDDDIRWIKDTFESADIHYEVSNTFIKAIK